MKDFSEIERPSEKIFTIEDLDKKEVTSLTNKNVSSQISYHERNKCYLHGGCLACLSIEAGYNFYEREKDLEIMEHLKPKRKLKNLRKIYELNLKQIASKEIKMKKLRDYYGEQDMKECTFYPKLKSKDDNRTQ